MAQVQYDNFDLKILPEGTGYRAFVESPAGEGNGSFAVPFNPEELEYLAPYPNRNNREIKLKERLEYREQNYKAFGEKLFRAVFSDRVEILFYQSLTKVKGENKGLRILLRLDAVPELARWPWEYLSVPSDGFLQFSRPTPVVIVRYSEVGKEAEPLAVPPPLKILVVISKPSDARVLDVEGEWTKLKEALSSLETRGQVQLERLEQATLGNLRQKLRTFQPHVLHYIGHGTFDKEGSLALEKDNGSSDLVSGERLLVQLGNNPYLKLVILNACQGAKASETDPYIGIAQQLLKSGIPAVIAMQYAIGDAAAKTFAGEFYNALADSNYPIDAALTEARRALFDSDPMEWGTPVLFMRSPDGSLFVKSDEIPPSVVSGKRSDVRDREYEIEFLKLMQERWIKGVLEKSLHNQVLIALEKEARPDAVYSWGIEVEDEKNERHLLPAGKNIFEIFEESGKALLILGGPGSGKTTLLLELARTAIVRGLQSQSQPLPVILNLSSWDSGESIKDWLVRQFNERYGIAKRYSEQWVTNEDHLLLLLDGLDEVNLDRQRKCLQAINAFREEYRTQMVVCCRISEYEAIKEKLRLRRAIFLQPLTLQQINDYLSKGGTKLDSLQQSLQVDTTLQELAKSPFMLNIMTIAYLNMTVEEVAHYKSIEERRNHIFDNYLRAMFKHRHYIKEQYNQSKTIRILSWLARGLIQHARTEFSPQQLQPSWLNNPYQRLSYIIGSVLSSSLAVGILGCLLALLLSVLWIKLLSFISPSSITELEVSPYSVFNKAVFQVYLGTFATYAIVAGLIVSSFIRRNIRYIERIRWSFRLSRKTAFYGFLIGSIFYFLSWQSLVMTLQSNNSFDEFATLAARQALEIWELDQQLEDQAMTAFVAIFRAAMYVSSVLIGGLTGTIIGGVGFGGATIQSTNAKLLSNPGWLSSIRASFTVSITTFGVILALILTLGFIFGNVLAAIEFEGLGIALCGAVISGFIFGGSTFIQLTVLRFVLRYQEGIPWNLSRFLDHAANHVFLHKVGNRYIFIHRLLLDYFANLELDDPLRDMLLSEHVASESGNLLIRIRQFLIEEYDPEDIRQLFFALSLNYDDLAEKSLSTKIGALLLYLGRLYYLPRLMINLYETRPEQFLRVFADVTPGMITSLTRAIQPTNASKKQLEKDLRIRLRFLNEIAPLVQSSLTNLLDNNLPITVTLDVTPLINPLGINKQTYLANEIDSLFDEVGRQLLIVGEMGSGKTTLLFELASKMLARMRQDTNQPIPIILNLSSWTDKIPFAEWLIDGVAKFYSLRRTRFQSLLDNNNIALLLDSLEEVQPKYQAACKVAINDFIKQNPAVNVVVCSREIEDESTADKSTSALKLSQVYLRPLEAREIDDFLVSIGNNYDGLRTALKSNSTLSQLSMVPLFLKILIRELKDVPYETIMSVDWENIDRNELVHFYVSKKIQNNGLSQKNGKLVHNSLFRLAKYMSKNQQNMAFNRELFQWRNPGFLISVFLGAILGAILGFYVWGIVFQNFYGVVIGYVLGGLIGGILFRIDLPLALPAAHYMDDAVSGKFLYRIGYSYSFCYRLYQEYFFHKTFLQSKEERSFVAMFGISSSAESKEE